MIWDKDRTTTNTQSATDDTALATSESAGLTRIETILVATDLSARSDRALARAVALADQHCARLVITHIFDEDLPASIQDRIMTTAREEIDASLNAAHCPDSLDRTVQITPGKDYRDILDASDACNADLLVLGVHSYEKRDKPFVGTTAERVLRHTQRPIIVANKQVRGPYAKVAIGADFSVFSRFAMRAGFAVAPDAAFSMVHAFQVPFAGFQSGSDARRQVRKEHEAELTRVVDEEMDVLIASALRSDAPKDVRKTILQGEPRAVLRAEVERMQPELLVLGAHGRVGVAHALLGSVAEDFLTRPPCDVLVVKAW